MPKDLRQLPKIKESISFLYVEHCRIEQDAMVVAKFDKNGKTPIPAANITCLLLGPGTVITHDAVKAVADCGCAIEWCGDDAFKFYAYGKGETRNGYNILKQAKLCMDEDLHMQVVKKMYSMRFSNMKVDGLTINQLRGIEGIRMKQAYKAAASKSGIAWQKRNLGQNTKWENLSDLDKALIVSNKILYAVCEAVILSMGLSPALGFIHTGRSESFAFDIADLYKAQTSIPAAFMATKYIRTNPAENLEGAVRRQCHMYFAQYKLMKRMPEDIASLLNVGDTDEQINPASALWNYGTKPTETESWNLSKLILGEIYGSDGDGEHQ